MSNNSRFSKITVGTLAALALAATPALAQSSGAVSTGHSSWDWGSPAPQGQTLNAVAFSGSTGYAVGDFGTVLRSDDSGATWTGLPSGTTSSLSLVQVVSPTTVVVAGQCDVSESTDGGASFKALPLDLVAGGCENPVVGVSFSDARHGYFELQDGSIYYTADGGATLQAKTSVPSPGGSGESTEATGLTFTSPTTGFATSSSGAIEETTDGANSWTLVDQAADGLSAMTFADPQDAYAVGGDGTMVGSTDAGQTWFALPLKLTSGVQAPDLTGIACASAGQCLITTGGGELIRTTDGGQTGTIVSPSSQNLFGVAFGTGSSAVAVGAGGATVVSTDGGATFPSVSSNTLRSFNPLTALTAGGTAGSVYAGGDLGTVAASTDAGASWSELRVPTAHDISGVQFPTTSVGYVLDSAGALHSTADGGLSWRSFTGSHDSRSALSAPSRRTVLLVGPAGIDRSTDAGATFTPVTGTVSRRSKAGHAGVLVSTLRLQTAITRSGIVMAWGGSGIVASVDRGASWQQVPSPVPSSQIRSLSFVSRKVIRLLTNRSRLYLTNDGGRTWTENRAIGGIGTISDVSFSSAQDGMLCLLDTAFSLEQTTFGGVTVLSTTDGGATWEPEAINDGNDADGVLDTPAAAYLTNDTQGNDDNADEQDTSFFATTEQGRVGSPTSLSLTLSKATMTQATLAKAGHQMTVQGTVSPVSVSGQTVVVSYRAPGGAWRVARTRVATGGSYSLTLPGIKGTTDFVAQTIGNGLVDGAGTPVHQLTVK